MISGIWKGASAAATGFFLSEKFRVCPIKLDGYLNIDPGTMNPIEHWEVFVLADGAEVDMDFGHYERFLNQDCSGTQSISMGKIYAWILEKERRGDFLGKTVQMIPHITDHIAERIEEVFAQNNGEICIIEVGWTVGDIEVELYLEAIRQMKQKKRKEDFLHIHLTYVPIPGWVMEQKTKPTQQSINLLQSRGLFPDIVFARGKTKLTKSSRQKIALFSNLKEDRVFSIPDLPSIYEIPEILKKQKFDMLLYGKLHIPPYQCDKLEIWRAALQNERKQEITVGLIGKYTTLEDSYSSIIEALKHAWNLLWVKIKIHFINTRKRNGIHSVKKVDACIIPWGFWSAAIEHMIETICYIRENKIPCLGICLWLQLMSIEYFRNVLGNGLANSIEFDKKCSPNDVITLLDGQKNIVNLGGTMRLWEQKSILKTWKIFTLYKNAGRISWRSIIKERFRHRFEVHPDYAMKLENTDLHIVWRSPKWIVQLIELDSKTHPYFVGTQAHPELTSRPENPAPLFVGLIEAALESKK